MPKSLFKDNSIYFVGLCEQKNGVHAICNWNEKQENVNNWVNALESKGENAVCIKLFGYQIDTFGQRRHQNG